MDPSAETRVLDLASPRRLWIWACLIALAGLALRGIWFHNYEQSLPFAFGSIFSGHLWLIPGAFATAGDVGTHHDILELTRAFAPGYGLLLRGAWEISATSHGVTLVLVSLQSLLAVLSTLLTFALSRRVLYGFSALIPCALMTISLALIELPGGLAPQIPLMFALVLLVWLLTLLHERGPLLQGAGPLLLTLAAGLTGGAAILLNPACLLLAVFVCWWALRGIGREHATLLLVATLLLPASWLAVVQTRAADGLPVAEISQTAEPFGVQAPESLNVAAERLWNLTTPWNPRFAKGAWASSNWNWEELLPVSLRTDTNYQSASKTLAVVWSALYVLLVLLGAVVVFFEAAGSAARLLALPVLTLALFTLVSPVGALLRLALLPFLMICLTLGGAWLAALLRDSRRSEPEFALAAEDDLLWEDAEADWTED